jgi:hypothetical protein
MASNEKPGLPSIDNELAAPRKRLDLKAIRPRAEIDDAIIEENSRKIGTEWGASTSLQPVAPADYPIPQRTPVANLRIEVPDYLDQELAMKAAAQRVTKQFLVLQAMKVAGYQVRDEDLVADRRKARHRKE